MLLACGHDVPPVVCDCPATCDPGCPCCCHEPSYCPRCGAAAATPAGPVLELELQLHTPRRTHAERMAHVQRALQPSCTCDRYPSGRIKSGADTSRCPNPDHRRLAQEVG